MLVCNATGSLLWSRDGGKTWRRFGSNPGLTGKRSVLRDGPVGLVQLLVSPAAPTAMRSSTPPDGGKACKKLLAPSPPTFLRRPLFDPTDPTAFLVGSDGAGVLRARLP